VLVHDPDDGWTTVFPDQKSIGKDDGLSGLTHAPGDGHATAASQFALSPQEVRALVSEPISVRDTHFHMILDRAAQRGILGFLLDESPAETAARAQAFIRKGGSNASDEGFFDR
jgi:hypothetical protein